MLEDSHPYAPVWSKYRPVILQLMSTAAANGPQQYQLYSHEFKSLSKKDKAFSFLLEAFNGKAVNNVKTSQVALDLLATLQQSKTASQLLRDTAFEFSLDKNFVFHVNRKNLPEN